MKDQMRAMHDALEARWKKAGQPAHASELCLWAMARHVDGLDQHSDLDVVLDEAVDLLEGWIECGEPATSSELEAIAKVKERAAVPRLNKMRRQA